MIVAQPPPWITSEFTGKTRSAATPSVHRFAVSFLAWATIAAGTRGQESRRKIMWLGLQTSAFSHRTLVWPPHVQRAENQQFACMPKPVCVTFARDITCASSTDDSAHMQRSARDRWNCATSLSNVALAVGSDISERLEGNTAASFASKRHEPATPTSQAMPPCEQQQQYALATLRAWLAS